jgi:hypothetical protein
LRHTSSIPVHAIDEFIITHLEQASVTTFTCPVVAAMPWSTHPVTLLPFLLSWTNSDNLANNFMAGDEREFGSESMSVSSIHIFGLQVPRDIEFVTMALS